MVRWFACLLWLLLAPPAWAQPAPPSPAPPSPAAAPQPSPRWGGIGGGINNRVSSDPNTLGDIGGTLNLELMYRGARTGHIGFKLYAHLAIREWGVIGDFYKDLHKQRGKEIVYGYLFGWLAGTDLVYAGPALTLYAAPQGESLFADVGIGAGIFIDPRDPCAAFGYGPMMGVGYGNDDVAVALRTIVSRPGQHGDLATPDITYYNVFFAIEGSLGNKKTSPAGP